MDFNFTKPYSEKTAELIDKEVKEIIEKSYDRATEVLKKHIKGLTELAELLLEKEVIFGEDLERIFGKRKGDKSRDMMSLAQAETPALETVKMEDQTATEEKPEKPSRKKKDGSGKSSGKVKVKVKDK
jgi:cell division protease FtsH